MTAVEIRAWLKLLPEDSPYWAWLRRQRPTDGGLRSLEKRIRLSLRDPAVGFHLVQSYAQTGLPLPAFITEPALLRANRFLLCPEPIDINMALAHSLTLPQTSNQRDLLRALLLTRDITVEEIAARCDMECDVIHLFHVLFWFCRNRGEEVLYGLIGVDQSEGQPVDLGQKLLRIAHQDGRAERVLAAAGLTRSTDQKPLAALQEDVWTGLLKLADEGVKRRRFRRADNPALGYCLQILGTKKHEAKDKSKPGITLAEALRLHAQTMGLNLDDPEKTLKTAAPDDYPERLPDPPSRKKPPAEQQKGDPEGNP